MHSLKVKTVSLVVLVSLASSVFAERQAFLTAEQILSTWEKNYGSPNSLEVECVDRIVNTEPGEGDPNYAKNVIKYVSMHRIEQGDKFYCLATVLRTPEELVTRETSFDGIEQREYTAKEKTGMISSKLEQNTLAAENLIDRYLLRWKPWKLSSASEPLNQLSEFKRPFEVARLYSTKRTISVRPFLEEVNGQICHVVELFKEEDGIAGVIIWVAHERSILPMKYQHIVGTKDKSYVDTAVEVLEIGFGESESGGLWYPKKARRTDCMPRYYGTITSEIEVSKFVPNVSPDPNIFKLKFPVGTRVVDTRIHESYIVGVEE